jgi:hypothetical protein
VVYTVENVKLFKMEDVKDAVDSSSKIDRFK